MKLLYLSLIKLLTEWRIDQFSKRDDSRRRLFSLSKILLGLTQTEAYLGLLLHLLALRFIACD